MNEQIEAYKDNFINVADLAREAELRQQDLEALERMKDEFEELQNKYTRESEINQDVQSTFRFLFFKKTISLVFQLSLPIFVTH